MRLVRSKLVELVWSLLLAWVAWQADTLLHIHDVLVRLFFFLFLWNIYFYSVNSFLFRKLCYLNFGILWLPFSVSYVWVLYLWPESVSSLWYESSLRQWTCTIIFILLWIKCYLFWRRDYYHESKSNPFFEQFSVFCCFLQSCFLKFVNNLFMMCYVHMYRSVKVFVNDTHYSSFPFGYWMWTIEFRSVMLLALDTLTSSWEHFKEKRRTFPPCRGIAHCGRCKL